MVWVDTINELDYYKGNSIPCICEALVYPNDLQLQGLLYNASNSSATITLYVYSPDGLTQYENATSYFDYYLAVYNNQKYFNVRLTNFSPAMCTYKCWIIRAVVVQDGMTIFDKWTQRYCNTNCCNVASGVIFAEENVITEGDNPQIDPDAPVTPQTNACGQQLIRLSTWFSCVDNFTGNIFADPATIISSQGETNWNYAINSTFRGRIVPRPRTITREISYNCRLQKAESAKMFLFEGFEYFPAWKMTEIEGQLHSDNIYVDDFVSFRSFTWDGGEAFNKVQNARDCDEVFKLSVNIRECIIRQFFGCAQDCTQQTTYFIIPEGYQSGSFYGESGELIATVYEGTSTSPAQTGLLDWFRNQNGVISVTDIDVSSFDCEMYALFSVEALGYIPSSIYFDSPIPRNRVYSLGLSDVTDICGYTGEIPCDTPVSGAVVVGDVDCATPVNGTVVVGDVAADDVPINGYGAWVDQIASHTAQVYSSQGTFSLDVLNNTTVFGNIGEDISFANEIIGTISQDGRPSIARVLDSTNNSAITDDSIIVVNTDGSITYTGTFTFIADNEVNLVFNNLVYNL